MAAATVTIIDDINIDSGWLSLTTGDNKGFYLVAIKGTKTDNDAMDLDALKQVVFQIGIDSGITSHPIPIGRYVFKFGDKYEDKALDGVAALCQLPMLPKSGVYIKILAFSDGFKEVRDGKMPVDINMLTV